VRASQSLPLVVSWRIGWAVNMLLEIGKAVSFFASILSLYALMGSAFFVPSSTWQERLLASLVRIGLAACVCFASGILFRQDEIRRAPESDPSLTRMLPVRLFYWGLASMAVLFALSWFLETYYIPHIWKNQPW
jgi:hypothetical protein